MMNNLRMLMLIVMLTVSIAQLSAQQPIPQVLTIQGVLTDAFGNKAMNGPCAISSAIYESPIGGLPLYQQIDSLNLSNDGVYQITLGALNGLPQILKFDRAYYIELSVNGIPQSMRIPVHPSPYAIMAKGVLPESITEEHLSVQFRKKLLNIIDKNAEHTFANNVGGLRSVIAGGDMNITSAAYASIIGGFKNSVSGSYGTIGGGESNMVSGLY